MELSNFANDPKVQSSEKASETATPQHGFAANTGHLLRHMQLWFFQILSLLQKSNDFLLTHLAFLYVMSHDSKEATS